MEIYIKYIEHSLSTVVKDVGDEKIVGMNKSEMLYSRLFLAGKYFCHVCQKLLATKINMTKKFKHTA